jgi:hypothetical protein
LTGAIRVPTIIVIGIEPRSPQTRIEVETMLRIPVAIGIFVAASWLAVALPGDKQVAKSLPGIEVKLRFSVDELDSLKPGDSYIECIVRNQSKKAVQVPVGYGAGFDQPTSLHTSWPLGLRMVLWGEAKKKQQAKLLKPGEEMILFKESLKEVLLLEMTKEKPLLPKERRYYWTWQA